MKALRFALVSLVLIALLAVGALYAGSRYLLQWGERATVLADPKVVELRKGTSLSSFAQQLAEAQVVSDARLFRLWIRFYSDYSKFQAGLYQFGGAVSPAQVATLVSRGEVYVPITLQFTIPEGFSSAKIFARLAAQGIGDEAAFQRLAKNKEFLTSLRIPADSVEGFLYPATYSFSKTPSPEEALSSMVNTFWEKLPRDYEAQVGSKGLTLMQAITFASLIEREAKLEDDKGKVSEVIWRRLTNKMPLAIDASLIYGIENYEGDITWKHLRDRSNPYNTRLHAGLPPTPICSPSVSSLHAVLNPTDQGYLYYVVDDEDHTRHHFSKTLREHNEQVRKYVRALRASRLRPTATPTFAAP